jgi:hypothetical protein
LYDGRFAVRRGSRGKVRFTGRTGRTHLRGVELADDNIRSFSTDSIDAHAAQVTHRVDAHTKEQYAYATGQDVNVVLDARLR